MYPFNYIKLQINEEYVRIQPTPLSLQELLSKCPIYFQPMPQNPILCYLDSAGDFVKLSENSDLMDLYLESTRPPKILLKNATIALPLPAKKFVEKPDIKEESNRAMIRDDELMNYSFLVQFKDTELTVQTSHFCYDIPTKFFHRVAQHIVHISIALGYQETAKIFKIPPSMIKFLQMKAQLELMHAYPLPDSMHT